MLKNVIYDEPNNNGILYGTNDPVGDIIKGQSGDDYIVGGGGADELIGGSGNDTIYGGNADLSPSFSSDILWGNEGNDRLFGNTGNNIFYGGSGNDRIYDSGANMIADGGTGNDIYYQNRFGDATITDPLGFDQLIFEDSVWGVLEFNRTEDDLLITASDNSSNGVVNLSNWFTAENHLEEVYGSDGLGVDLATYLTTTQPDIYTNTIDGSDENDILTGSVNRDIIYGNAGDDELTGGQGFDELWGGTGKDTLIGGGGNDKLHGGDDWDTLLGGAGDDNLKGGAGKDVLKGQEGNDLYRFRAGDSWDIISDEGNSARDILYFDASINFEDVTFEKVAGKAHIDILTGGAGDRVRLINQLAPFDTNKIEVFNFNNTTILSADDVNQLLG